MKSYTRGVLRAAAEVDLWACWLLNGNGKAKRGVKDKFKPR